MEQINEHLRFFAVAIVFWGSFYMIPYLIRKAWGDAENRTKKVCDVCFRDIVKWNALVKKQESENKKQRSK